MFTSANSKNTRNDVNNNSGGCNIRQEVRISHRSNINSNSRSTSPGSPKGHYS